MTDDFAICPENGPPRLFRFDIDDDRILSQLDAETNVLHINKWLYDHLPAHMQQEVFKTRAKVLTLDNLSPGF